MNSKRIALITGANRGIGFEVRRQLGRMGYTLVLGCRSEARGRTAQETLRAEDIEATCVGLDMAEPASIEAAAAQVGQDYPHLDVLVNNAAIHYDTWQRASNADLDIVQEAITTNALGPLAAVDGAAALAAAVRGAAHRQRVERWRVHRLNVREDAGLQRLEGGAQCRHANVGTRP